MKKRIFSRVLALVMALALLSTTALADVSFDDLQEAIDGTGEQTEATTSVKAEQVPQPETPDTPEVPEDPETPAGQETPAAPEREAGEDETHKNGALVRTENDINYYGYGWSWTGEETNKTWYYAIEAHTANGERVVLLLDDVSKGNGEASGVVIGEDGSSTNVTIDMNDHNLKGGEGAVVKVEEGATLNLNNGTVTGGEIGIDVFGTLFLDSVTVTQNSTGININDKGKVTFKGDKNVVKDNETNLAGEGLVDFTLTVGDKEVTYKVDTKTAEKLLEEKDNIQDGGDNWKKTKDGSIVLFTGNNKNLDAGTITRILDNVKNATGFLIPEGVTEIGEGAFNARKTLQTINIPSTVTKIGLRAFYYCNGWSNDITIPNGLTEIGKEAFSSCTNLKGNLEFNALETMGESAFGNCKSITGISFSSGCKLKEIPKGAFSDCSSLAGNVNIPGSVTSIGWRAFNKCSNLDGVTLPDGVKTIGSGAFSECKKLREITIPSSVTNIGSLAFYHCDQITSVIIPNGVTSIEESAFSCCGKLASVTIPESVKTIGRWAFNCCFALESVKIPENVTEIKYQAFAWCGNLKSIDIPNTVTTIEAETFRGCTNLETITIPASVSNFGDKVLLNSGVKSVWIPSGDGSEATAKIVAEKADINIYVKDDAENLSFYRGKVIADFGHYSADNDVNRNDGSVALTNVSGSITVGDDTVALPNVPGVSVSIDTDGNITVRAPITVDGTEYPNGATIAPDGTVEALPEPPVTEEPDTGTVITPDFSFDAAGTDSGTTIEDEAVPLAGLVTLAQLLDALRQHEGIEDVELPEDFQWADHDYAQAIYWGLDEALVIDTEDEPLDPDEIVTVAILREVMTNYAAYLDTTFDVVIEGEDDMIVMNCDEILAEFYASLEEKAA